MTAIRVTDAPNVDGKLDDPVWQAIEFTGGFLQREPDEGAPVSERTEVAVIYDSDNVYFGARCYDSEPDKIRGSEMRRDVSPSKDDYFDIVLDTYHDRRSAFFFTITPAGGRLDGTISEDGKIDNRDWDGIWTGKTSRDGNGWYVEVAIPLQTLRFREGDDVVWGAHFVRRILRKNEEAFWRLVPLYAGRLGQNRISEAGEIHGFDGLKMGGQFEFEPFVTGGLQDDIGTNNRTVRRGDLGADMKWNVTSTLTADFTYNTDFAQVEADQERVNLTRFDLFFPEKRSFFLEGAETFAFGSEGINPYSSEAGAIQLFYSRRIGIEERRRVPITGGARLTGKAGGNTILGLMSIRTESAPLGDDSGTVVPATDYSVIRVKQNIFSRSSVGMMFLNKQEAGGTYNRSFGFDSNFNASETFSFFLSGAGTFTSSTIDIPDGGKDNLAGYGGFNYQSDLWQYSGSFLNIEDSFNPEMGFVSRTGIQRTNGRLTYSPRPQRWEPVRKLNYTVRGYYQTDSGSRVLNRQVAGDFSINFQNTASFRATVEHEYEYLDFDWDVREGLLIPESGYSSTTGRMSFSTNRARDIGGSVNISGGDYFTGTRRGAGFTANIQTFNRMLSDLNYNYNWITLPDGQFHTNTLSARISYSFNPDLFVKAYLQWYDDARRNDGRDRFSGNIILRYIYMPGSDFYLVLNQESLVGPGGTETQNRTILAKLTYFLRR
ncbi:DUF5916 domain-containing protein [candidate division KSB1 bacterium]